VTSSPNGALRMIWICWADPFAPCTKGSVRGRTPSDVPLPMKLLKVCVDVLSQVATLVWVPAAGIPPLQLANGIVNLRQLAFAVGFGGSHPPVAFGT